MYGYQVKKRDDEKLRTRLRELAEQRKRWGCPMLHAVLKREGLVQNHKRTERIYKEENLIIHKRRRKKRASHVRLDVEKATRSNEIWAMDFIEDRLSSGRKLRCLTIVDTFTKEGIAIETDTSLGGERVTRVLDRISMTRDLPKYITIDNGPEFISRAMDDWAYRNNVQLNFSRPGKPVDNCYIESFHDKFREECLNMHYFSTLAEAKYIIEGWRRDYNEVRPHSTLNYQTPNEFAQKIENQVGINTVKLYSRVVLKRG